jgi:sulfite oxidase
MTYSDRAQPPNEWLVEQGMAPNEMTLMDESTPADRAALRAHHTEKSTNLPPPPEDVDPDVDFAEEYPGWGGYVEWERYPEKKAKAAAILASHTFPFAPEYQLIPIPGTNPVLEGVRWKMWHETVGGRLKTMPQESWDRVLMEKHKDMLHILRFPYNGEAPKRLVTANA